MGFFLRGWVHMCIKTHAYVCVCVGVCVLLGSVSVCLFTFVSHVNTAGVSCSMPGHVTDTCRRRVQRWAANRSLSRHETCPLLLSPPPSVSHSLSLSRSPPLLPSLQCCPLPVQSSSPSLAGLSSKTAADSEPRHRLYPAEITWTRVCFGHVSAILFQLSESSLV